jgi:GT2 family glycosyltransferase
VPNQQRVDVQSSESPPFASIVVPTFNRVARLRDCLESLLQQDYPSGQFEILVVDDGSSDGSAEMVNGLDGVRYLRRQHAGLNAARNAGIEEAKGDFLAFLDDDVLAPPSWLRTMITGAQANPAADCFGGKIRLQLEGRPPRYCGRHPLNESELDLGDVDREVEFIWGANMTVARRAFELAGRFDERLPLYNEELEWQQRLRAAGGSIVYLPNAWVWHRRSTDDLRVSALLRRHFARGLGQAAFFAAAGRPLRVRDGLRRVPRRLAHAVGRRCWWGVFEAAGQVGFACGAARHTLGRR